MKKFIAFLLLVSVGLFFSSLPGLAQNITLTTNTTSEQKMTAAGTLTVNPGVTLAVKGGNPAVYFNDTTSNDTLTVNNNGTIEQNGTVAGGNQGDGLQDNQGHDTIIINNGTTTNSAALIETSDDDAIHLSKGSNNVTLNNYGMIISLNASQGGSQGVNLNGITSGTNIINNFSTGLIMVTDSDAVRPGVNGYVYNDGTIKSVNTVGNTSGSDGVDAQTDSGVTIVNGHAISGDLTTGSNLIEGARHGITGGNTGTTTNSPTYTGSSLYTMTVINNSNGTIQADNGAGINIDGFGLPTSTNAGAPYTTSEVVTVTNSGTITGDGVTRDGDAIDVDGDLNLVNSGTIHSLNAFNDISEGVTVGGAVIVNSGTIEGSVVLSSSNTTAVGRGITLAGLDKGADDSQIPLESIYENSIITNTNGGVIKGDTESGIAVLGTTGGGYSVTITNYAGALIEGSNSGVSEDSVISSTNQYNGQLSGQSLNQAAIELDDTSNTYTITDSGTIKQDNLTNATGAIAMHGLSNTLNIYGGSASIIGNITGNTAANSLLTINPGNGNSFSYGYAISNFTVHINSDGSNGTVILSGTNTYNGTTTVGGGVLSINALASLGSAQPLGTGSNVVFTGASASAPGTLQYTGTSATLGQTLTVSTGDYGTVYNSGGGVLTLNGGISKNGSVFTLAGGEFIVSAPITGSSNHSDLDLGSTTYTGTTTVALTTTNSYNGPTVITEGSTLITGTNNALPTTSNTALTFGAVTDAANSVNTLDLDGTQETVASLAAVAGTNGATTAQVINSNATISGTNIFSGTNANSSAGSLTVDYTNTGTNDVFSGSLGGSGPSNNFSLSVTGGGTLVLSGSNTYTGSTTVSGGSTLLVTGSNTGSTNSTISGGGVLNVQGSSASTGNVTVGSGGTLQGSGTAGNILVQTAGVVSPGSGFTLGTNLTAGPGETGSTNNILTAASLTVSANSTLSYNLYHATASTSTATDAAGSTLIVLTGGFYGTGVSSTPGDQVNLNFNYTASSGNVGSPNVYDLVEWSNVGGTNDLTNLTTSDFDLVDVSSVTQNATLQITYLGNNVEALQLDVVPEPSTWAMFALGLGLLVVAVRKRKSMVRR